MSEVNLENWFQRIDRITEEVISNFGNLTFDQLNKKPSSDSWSIAQHLDHLIVINSSYYPVIESAQSGELSLSWTGKVGFLVRFFGRAILKGVEPTNKKKTKTFPIWEPESSDIDSGIIERFTQHQEELKELIRSSKDLIASNAVIPSPANKSINYKVGDAFEIIVTHEKRHVNHALSLL